MKIRGVKTLAFITLLSTVFVLGACNKEGNLSEKEVADLKYLREEEKLARDVYLFSFDKYGEDIFENIARSEQKHMDKMLNLLDVYGIEDPATNERGVFTNSELQNLYNILISKSDSSLLDALIVGATIEDVDIFDIDSFILSATGTKIMNTYAKLECGSNNHMRAFTDNLLAHNYIYEPQFISIEKLNDILASESGGCGK